jgi:hypothetical protein
MTVVISQTNNRGSSAADFEEQLLTEIMFQPNLDAVLIGPLERLNAGGTDELCLSQLPAGSILLGWLGESQAAQCLSEAGVDWRLSSSPTTAAKSLLYRQLSPDEPKERVLAELLARLRELSVRPFQIVLGKKAASTTPWIPAIAPPSPTAEQASTASHPRPMDGSKSPHDGVASAKQSEPVGRSLRTEIASDDPAWPELDQLVDQLDLLDL